MEDSIFTKIVKGEIPSHKIYEDDRTIAFLDIHPKYEGHCLVVPKNQVEFIWDLSEEDYTAVMSTVRMVAKRLREVIQAKYVGSQIVGIDVPHAHVHVFPFNTVEEFRFTPDKNGPVDNSKLASIAEKLLIEVK